ncbi:hypothetical protein ACJX0J_040951 [Zea mays]
MEKKDMGLESARFLTKLSPCDMRDYEYRELAKTHQKLPQIRLRKAVQAQLEEHVETIIILTNPRTLARAYAHASLGFTVRLSGYPVRTSHIILTERAHVDTENRNSYLLVLQMKNIKLF